MTVDELLAALPEVLAAEGLSHIVDPGIEVHRGGNIETVILPTGNAPVSPGPVKTGAYVCWRAHGAVPDWASLESSIRKDARTPAAPASREDRRNP
jgi:hypothetical protein